MVCGSEWSELSEASFQVKPAKDISICVLHSAGVTLVCADGQVEAHNKMALTAKTRLAKRKHDIQKTRKENQTLTSKELPMKIQMKIWNG